jgi:glycosyltransferase involved in cell wall biosynthesis
MDGESTIISIPSPTEKLNWPAHDLASRRRFCIVTDTYPPEINGVALTLARLVEGLRLLGHAVSVVRPRQRAGDAKEYGDHSTDTLVPGLPLLGYKGVRFGLPAGAMLDRCWSHCSPDVVYVATEGPLGWSAVSAARRLGIRVFSGFHTNFDGYARHYHADWLRPLIVRYLEKLHNRTDGTLVASHDLRERLCAIGIRNLSVLGRGVDSGLFNPGRRSAAVRRAWRASEQDRVALYVGRIAPEKNLALAIEAYRAMQKVTGSVKFVIIGDGPLRANLQAKHPDLIFCGVHTGEELAKRYASADIFLFPSETETFGNVTLEAMASGLAVVAFNYAAAQAHIVNGKNGVLVPKGNSRAFVEAVAGLADQTQRLAEIGRLARASAVALDWQRVVEKFAALLIGALDEDDRAHAHAGGTAFEATPAGY